MRKIVGKLIFRTSWYTHARACVGEQVIVIFSKKKLPAQIGFRLQLQCKKKLLHTVSHIYGDFEKSQSREGSKCLILCFQQISLRLKGLYSEFFQFLFIFSPCAEKMDQKKTEYGHFSRTVCPINLALWSYNSKRVYWTHYCFLCCLFPYIISFSLTIFQKI